MIKLLKHYINKRTITTIITSIILMIIVYINEVDAEYIGKMYQGDNMPYLDTPINLPFGNIITYAIILSIIFTVLEFSFKMKKVTIDQMYSIPIKRSKLYITKYLIGLFEIIVPLTLSYIVMILMIVTNEHMFNLVYAIPHYFGVIFLTVILYTTLVFIFTRCNNTVDGLINILLYTFVTSVIIVGLELKNGINYTIMSPLILFNNVMEFKTYGFIEYFNQKDITELIISSIYNIVLCIIMVILFFVFIKKEKAEASEGKSNSLFAYNLMIPLYTTFLVARLIDTTISTTIIIIIAAYIGYVIKNRSFKLTKKDWIIFGISVLLAFVLRIILNIF